MKKRLYYIVVLDIKDDKFYFFDKNQIKELKDLSDIKSICNALKRFETKKKAINFIKANKNYGFRVFQMIKTKNKEYRKKVFNL